MDQFVDLCLDEANAQAEAMTNACSTHCVCDESSGKASSVQTQDDEAQAIENKMRELGYI